MAVVRGRGTDETDFPGEGGSRRARPQKRNDDGNLRSKAAGAECYADEMNLPPGAKNCRAKPELQKKAACIAASRFLFWC